MAHNFGCQICAGEVQEAGMSDAFELNSFLQLTGEDQETIHLN